MRNFLIKPKNIISEVLKPISSTQRVKWGKFLIKMLYLKFTFLNSKKKKHVKRIHLYVVAMLDKLLVVEKSLIIIDLFHK